MEMADILWKSSQDSSQSSPNTTTSGRSSTRISIPDLDIDSQPEIMKNQPETLDRPITPPLVCSSMFCALIFPFALAQCLRAERHPNMIQTHQFRTKKLLMSTQMLRSPALSAQMPQILCTNNRMHLMLEPRCVLLQDLLSQWLSIETVGIIVSQYQTR